MTLNETLADADPVIGRIQRMVTYGRDDALTAALSAWCDLRSSGAGRGRRQDPLSPSARELTFLDRNSWAALSVPGRRAADPAAKRGAVLGFANDGAGSYRPPA